MPQGEGISDGVECMLSSIIRLTQGGVVVFTKNLAGHIVDVEELPIVLAPRKSPHLDILLVQASRYQMFVGHTTIAIAKAVSPTLAVIRLLVSHISSVG